MASVFPVNNVNLFPYVMEAGLRDRPTRCEGTIGTVTGKMYANKNPTLCSAGYPDGTARWDGLPFQ